MQKEKVKVRQKKTLSNNVHAHQGQGYFYTVDKYHRINTQYYVLMRLKTTIKNKQKSASTLKFFHRSSEG